MFLRQSTIQTIRFGPFLDSTDGVTAETGLTVAQADRQLSKDGGAFAQSGETGNSTHDTDGWYSDNLTAADTNTVGELILQVVVSGALPVWHRYYVVEEAVYDAMYAASAAGPLQSTTAGRTLDVTATGAAGIDWGNVENPTTALDLSGTDIQLCDTVTTNTDMRGTDNAALASVLGALNDAAAAGDPTATDTVVQYLKQIINTLEGTTGIPTFPAEAAPANNVSMVEVLRAVHADVTGLNGDAMRGTDGANTTTPPTVVAIRSEIDSNSTQLAAIVADTNELQTDWANGGRLDLILDARASQTSVDTVDTNVDNLNLGIIYGTAQTGTLSTTQATSDLTGFADDELNGRVIVFTGGTADGQASDITDYASTNGLVTFTAITTAPANGDTFKIV